MNNINMQLGKSFWVNGVGARMVAPYLSNLVPSIEALVLYLFIIFIVFQTITYT